MISLRATCGTFAVAVFLGLSGCGDELVTYTPETPAERELRESREALQRTVGEGGLAGAGAGALIGAAAGGVQGAFSGAQIGRLGGAAAGGYVKQLQERYASEEQVLDAVVADLRTTNARMDDSIRAMRAALAERQTGTAEAAVRDERLKAEVDDTLTVARQQEEFFASTRSLLISDGMGTGASIDPELARLRERVASMQSISNTLAGI
ncbi:hypothetical protein DKT77_18705 [Meridianimarinicoccus roseus]|uniref:Glycine zipper domain-containing protein n=1 Tax=Meridianimarinicoccus roseus TaxID=2072018 RepID=A0A2V2LD75_9RHOB|nr:hypothetical protein [Meridianimarinicoccus roseus]PWR01187.1 hypothetical protein DKT77_18705 [Meridianimarinicoccus roseus]